MNDLAGLCLNTGCPLRHTETDEYGNRWHIPSGTPYTTPLERALRSGAIYEPKRWWEQASDWLDALDHESFQGLVVVGAIVVFALALIALGVTS
jgi:hypothetical protein